MDQRVLNSHQRKLKVETDWTSQKTQVKGRLDSNRKRTKKTWAISQKFLE